MELLAGEPNYLTEVNEKGIKYKLDFSKVIKIYSLINFF